MWSIITYDAYRVIKSNSVCYSLSHAVYIMQANYDIMNVEQKCDSQTKENSQKFLAMHKHSECNGRVWKVRLRD